MSQVHLEHRKHLERDLRNAGIKPEISRTGSGHMRFDFEAAGKSYFILTSWTPSDHRATLNARARIRKILRATGMLNKAVPVTKLDKALAAPVPTDPFAERIEYLEHTVDTLLDLCAVLAERAGVDLEPPEAPPEPEPAVVYDPTIFHRANTPRHSKVYDLLSAMTFNWLPVADIVKRSGHERRAMVSSLAYAKQQGLVENGQRGMWRRVPGTVIPETRKWSVPKSGPSKSKRHDLLLNMEYDWLQFQEIVRRSAPRSRIAVSVALNSLKKKGLVENGVRGMWRKVFQKANGHVPQTNGVHASV